MATSSGPELVSDCGGHRNGGVVGSELIGKLVGFDVVGDAVVFAVVFCYAVGDMVRFEVAGEGGGSVVVGDV